MAVGLKEIWGGLQYFDENGYQAKGMKYVTPDGKLYYFEGNGVQAKGKLLTYRGKKYYFDANSVGQKLMASGMNSTIKVMHKLRRVNSTQLMAQHGSTAMQLVKM